MIGITRKKLIVFGCVLIAVGSVLNGLGIWLTYNGIVSMWEAQFAFLGLTQALSSIGVAALLAAWIFRMREP